MGEAICRIRVLAGMRHHVEYPFSLLHETLIVRLFQTKAPPFKKQPDSIKSKT